jgi:hypothetical protein
VCVDATSGRGTRPHPHGFALTDGRVRWLGAGIREVSSSCVIVTAARFVSSERRHGERRARTRVRGGQSKGHGSPVPLFFLPPSFLLILPRPSGRLVVLAIIDRLCVSFLCR